MQIKVRSLQGDEYVVQVQEDQLVSKLKASISMQANGPPVERQKLVYKGRTMQDPMPISEYHLEEDCKVHLIIQKESATLPTPSSGNSNAATTSSSTSSSYSKSDSTTTTTTATTSATSPASKRSPGSPCPMDISSSSLDDRTPSSSSDNQARVQSSNSSNTNSSSSRPSAGRFELILRERLNHHFPSDSVDKIMANLYQEIDADISSSSLDDLERLAKQKLNISNE